MPTFAANDDVQHGTFKFRQFGDDSDCDGEYYYRDSYFANPSTSYNHQLAVMTCDLTFSAFQSLDHEEDDPSHNAEALLTDIGFEDFVASDGYYNTDDINSCAAAT